MTDRHPWAWWVWALMAAASLSATTNPLVVSLVVAAVIAVLVTRRTAAPWARSIKAYLLLALVIVAVRVFFMLLVGGERFGTVLVHLPEVELPEWAAGIQLGGDITLNVILAASYDGLRLAAIIVCVGTANALANPRRTLKSVPAAFHEISVAIVIALALAPQLIESGQRVRRARRLRGGRVRGWRALPALLVPVLEDAVERSIQLAASMESRGFGRTREGRRASPWATTALLVGACLVVLGCFLVLSVAHTLVWSVVAISAGVALVVVGLRAAGRRLAISHYRPDPWRLGDTLTCLSAAASAVILVATSLRRPAVMNPSTSPLVWPSVPLTAWAGVALLLTPLTLTRVPTDNPLLNPEAVR